MDLQQHLQSAGGEAGESYDAQDEFERYEQQAADETRAAAARMAAMYAGGDAYQPTSAAESSSYSAAPSSFSPSATRASAAMHRHAASSSAASASSAAASSSRFASSGVSLGSGVRFQYSVRLLVALVPGLLVALVIGGRSLGAIWAIGLLALYVLDSLGAAEEASFVALWVGALASMASLALSNSLRADVLGGLLFEILLLTHVNLVVFLAALGASLRFDFLAGELLEVWRVERVLFAAALLPLTVLEFLAALSALGPDGAPWLLALILAANYHLLATPLPSSRQLCELGLDALSLARNKVAYAKAARLAAAAQRRAAMSSVSSSSVLLHRPMSAAPLAIPLSEMDLVVSAPVAALYGLLVVWLPYFTYLALHTPGGSLLAALANSIAPHAVMILNASVLLLAIAVKDGQSDHHKAEPSRSRGRQGKQSLLFLSLQLC